MELGGRIREYRTEKSWSQEELAERCYVSRQTVSNWENEKSFPDVRSLLLLGDAFGVSLDELIKGDVEAMNEKVRSDDAKTYRRAQYLGLLGILGMMVVGTLLFELVSPALGGVFLGASAVCVIMAFHRMESIKKDSDIQTYREVLAFLNGETLDDQGKQKELKNRKKMITAEVIAAVQGIAVLLAAAGLVIWQLVK